MEHARRDGELPARSPLDDDTALALRGFGPLGLIAIAAILLTGTIAVRGLPLMPVGAVLVLVGAVLVLVWAWIYWELEAAVARFIFK
jgi:hypothetical protein